MISVREIAAIFAAFYLFWGGVHPAQAAPGEWTVTLSVSIPYSSVPGGVLSNTLSAGIRNEATSGYDPAMDTVSLLEPDDPIQVHFPHGAVVKTAPNDGTIQRWDCPDPEPGYTAYQCSLWRDFRGMNESEQIWIFEVLSTLNGATVSLNWRLDGDPDDLAQTELTLVDLSSTPPLPPIEMGPASSTKNYQYTNQVGSDQKYGLRKFEIRMKKSAPVVTPGVLPPAVQQVAYRAVLSLTGGGGSWSLDRGELPPGLGLDASTGLIEGFPESEGIYSFTVRAADPVQGLTASRSYSIRVYPPLTMTTSDFPTGTVQALCAFSLEAAGGAGSYRWSLLSGTLPDGVGLNGDGLLSGTFLVPGFFDFTIRVSDTATGAEDSRIFRMTVLEPSDEQSPSVITDLQELYADAGTAVVSWSAPWDDSLTGTAAAYDLRYLMDCTSPLEMQGRWDESLTVSGEPRPQPGILHVYTLNGLPAGGRTCVAVRSMDASGHLSEVSNVIVVSDSDFAGNGSVETEVVQLSLHKGFNLISLPVIPTTNPVLTGAGGTGGPAVFWRWYSFLPGLTVPEWHMESFPQPGRGYFIEIPESEGTLEVRGLPTAGSEYRIRLQGGWNMVGNPYGLDLLLTDIEVREIKESGDGEMKTFEEASRSGWVGNSLYAFTGLTYEFLAVNNDPPTVLHPGIGFWLQVREEGTYDMIFRRPQ